MGKYGVVFLLALAMTCSAFAQKNTHEVSLNDGRTIKGEVIEKEGVVTINSTTGLFQFNKDAVKEIKELKVEEPEEEQKDVPAAEPKIVGDKENPVVTLHTNRGKITIELFEDDAPNTVANFVKLAGDGFYDGIAFHRIMKNFMMQGGDPLSKEENNPMVGTGGPGYTFDDEINSWKNKTGYVSMANAGPATNGSQFFILFSDQPSLDPKHTVFGKVTDDTMAVVKGVNAEVAPPPPGQKPLSRVVIKKATVDAKRDHAYEPKVKKD